MLLPWLIVIPFLGGFFCWKIECFGMKIPRWISLIITGLVLIISLKIWIQNNFLLHQNFEISRWQSEFLLPWIPRFGITLHLAIDGFSLIMIMLTGLLGFFSVLCSWREIKKNHGFFYFNLMWVLSSVIGVFLAIDMFLFFFFWEMMLIPMYFLITIWGYNTSESKTRFAAATKFCIYTQASGLIMLVAILSLVFLHYNITGLWTFDYEQLSKISIPNNIEYVLMLIFFCAFAIKIPIVPLHGWLPDVHSGAPTAGSVDLTGILLKTSVYGLLRFLIPLFPNASKEFAPIAMVLGIVNIFYGALVSFNQYDIKRLIAYISISHMGLILIAIYTGSYLVYQGIVIQLVSHSLSTAGLFILFGQLYERIGTYNMKMMGGLLSKIKWLPAFAIFFTISTLGIPGTGNFSGEFMILFGSFKMIPKTIVIAIFGLILTFICLLIMLHRVFFGEVKIKISTQELSKISIRELCIAFPLIILLVFLGYYPNFILDISHCAMNNINNGSLIPIL